MHLLLLNNNPAVSRLIKLSVDKVGYALDEFEDYGLVPIKHYDLIMVDNECCDEEELATLCDNASCQYVLYITQRGAQKPDFANAILEKPFLPTDFLSLLEKIKNVLESLKPEPVHEEIDLTEEAFHVPQEEEPSFDIDAIDTFGVEDDSMAATPTLDDETDSFEELSLEEDEPSKDADAFEMQMDSLDKDNKEEVDSFALPTFDLDANTEDDELELPFIHESASVEQSPLVETSEDTDDCATEEGLLEKEVLSEPTILDKDDINEVKQLLDDDEEEEEFSLEEDKFDIHSDETVEEDKGSVLEDLSFEEEDEPLSFEDVPQELSLELENSPEETEVEEEVLPPTQDEMIDDFEEVIEERIEEERLEPAIDVSLNEVVLPVAKEFDSLDDLNENAIKRAFGEEVEEEIVEEVPTAIDATTQEQDVEVIRGEIESTIAHSLSTLAQSDILREALKGMRINISITFDEKN